MRISGISKRVAVFQRRRQSGHGLPFCTALLLVEILHRQSLGYWHDAEGFLRVNTEIHATRA